jgi:large subunit ribosomal protein L5
MAKEKNTEAAVEAQEGASEPKAELKESKPKKEPKKEAKKEPKKEPKKEAKPKQPAPRPRLLTYYEQEVAPKLMKEFGYKNKMQIPRLTKITINMGLGEAVSNVKIIDSAVEELRAICGQHPVVTKARKSVANFKLRLGMPIGAMVTLRRAHMWEFLDRLFSIALPRVRDFKGLSTKAFDGRGNYALGIREQIIFPEINYDKIDKIKGLGVTIVTTAKNDKESKALLEYLGMPFRK